VDRGTPRHICALGDALLDVIVELSRLPVADDDVPARITLTSGGQAANVAAWCVALGVRASVVSRLSSDLAGLFVRSALSQRHVEVLGPVDVGKTGTIASFATPDGKRSMASDRGLVAGFATAELDPTWFAGCSWLHISGYSLFGDDDGGEMALSAASVVHAGGAKVSVDLSAATLVESIGRAEASRRVLATGASIVFANEAELQAAGVLEVPTVVVKRGAAGCRVIERGISRELPAIGGAVVRDTTGAGDAFAAGWIVGGPELALRAAYECVGHEGAMPPVDESAGTQSRGLEATIRDVGSPNGSEKTGG